MLLSVTGPERRRTRIRFPWTAIGAVRRTAPDSRISVFRDGGGGRAPHDAFPPPPSRYWCFSRAPQAVGVTGLQVCAFLRSGGILKETRHSLAGSGIPAWRRRKGSA